jgi:hypothetical protein
VSHMLLRGSLGGMQKLHDMSEEKPVGALNSHLSAHAPWLVRMIG